MADEDQTQSATDVAEAPAEDQAAGPGESNESKPDEGGETGNALQEIMVGSGGKNIDGNHVAVFNLSVDDGKPVRRGWKAKSKSKIIIFGEGLGIYNQAFVRILGSNWDTYRGVSFTRSSAAPSFYLPDLGTLYKNKSKIYFDLYNKANPKVTIRIRPFLRYKAKEEEEDEKKAKAKQIGEEELKIRKSQESSKAGFAAEPALPVPEAKAGQELVDVLKKGDKQEIKDGIKSLIKKGDSKTLEQALKYAKENRILGDYIKEIEKGLATIASLFSPVAALVGKVPYDDQDFNYDVDDKAEASDAGKLDETGQAEDLAAPAKVSGQANFETKDRRRVQAQKEEIRQVGEAASAAGAVLASEKAETQESAKPEIKVTDRRRVTAESEIQGGSGKVSATVGGESARAAVSGQVAATVGGQVFGQAEVGGGQISTQAVGAGESVQAGSSVGVTAEIKAQGEVSGQTKVSGAAAGAAESTAKQQVSGSVSTGVEGKVSQKIEGQGTFRVEAGQSAGARISGEKEEITAKAEEESEVAGIPKPEENIEHQPQQVREKLEIAGRLLAKAPGSSGGQIGSGGLTRGQSAGVIGEYLDKNPGLITDEKVRVKVLEALSSGNLAGLNAEGTVALKQALRAIAKQAPNDERLNDAGANLKQELGGVSERTKQVSGEQKETASLMGGAASSMEKAASMPKEAVTPHEPESVEKKLEQAAMVKKLAEQDRKLSGTKDLGGFRKPGIGPLTGRVTSPRIISPPRGGSFGGSVQALARQLSPSEVEQRPGMPALPVPGETISEEDQGLNISGLEGSEEHKTWVKRSLIVKRSLEIAEEIGRLTGRDDLANIAQDLQNGLSWDDVKNLNDAGAIRNAASNMAGNYAAGKAAGGLGLSGGKSAAIGGAVAGALQGEGAAGIAKNALSWYILYVAFGSLFTLFGSIPALIYLDIHYIMNKMGVSWFASMTVKQRAALLVANIVIIGLTLLAIVSFMYIGCHYPVGKIGIGGVSTYKGSVMGLAGYGSICESLEGGFQGGGGSSGGAGASGSFGSGTCLPATSGPATVANLSSTCFGSNANKASAIANAESGGLDSRPSGVDKCQPGNEPVSWGLFQINLTAHQIGGFNCPQAFDKMYTGANHQCKVVDSALYNSCVQAAKDAQLNIQVACQISGNGQNWNAWGANQKCGF